MNEDRMGETAQDAVEHEEPDGMFPFDLDTLDGARRGIRPGLMMLGLLSGLFGVIGLATLLSTPWDGIFGEDATTQSFDRALGMIIGGGALLFLASIGLLLCWLISERVQLAIYIAMGFAGLFLAAGVFLLVSGGLVPGLILIVLTAFVEFTLGKAMSANIAYKRLLAQASRQSPGVAPVAAATGPGA